METLFIGKNLVFLPETPSTNSYATNLLKNVNLPEGSVIYTTHQTHGKGQRGSQWQAEPGSNLACSVVLRPTFLSLNKQFFLYQLAACACHDTIAHLMGKGHFDIKIKWPNDILVNRKKVAGVLIENNLLNNQLNWSVIGIGINMNQEVFEELPHAASLKQLTGQSVSINNTLSLLCEYFEKYYLLLMNEKFEQLTHTYLNSLFGYNEWMNFEVNGQVKHYLVKGVGSQGLLMLQNELGVVWEADVKEVKWLY